jgi:phosphonopyruvate decarboxylase
VVDCQTLDALLAKAGVTFFTGVPDSCFKPWIEYLLKTRPDDHVIATNEGEALAIAAGYNLATGRPAGVYLQNAGLGNLLDPLTSIVDEYVYRIPVLLMVSWRGKPGEPDEPQHKRMGEATIPLLEMLRIPYAIFHETTLRETIETKLVNASRTGRPFALILRDGDIEKFTAAEHPRDTARLTRQEAIRSIAKFYGNNTIFFATTGKTSRELYLFRDTTDQDHSKDFLNVGGMGWVASIAFGFSRKSTKRIVILDGDGSVLMHMGNLATIGHYKPPNILHFILDNNAHDSVGGLATVSETVNFGRVGEAVGYRQSFKVTTLEELERTLLLLSDQKGPSLITVNVKRGAQADLPRPSLTPQQRKTLFLDALAGLNDKDNET